MSLRAIILGLIGAVLIAGLGYLNDQILRLNFLVGNHFPISVFGLLLVMVLAVNPLLYMAKRTWALRPAELAVATTMVLVACSVPGSSLMRVFTPALAMPIQYNQTNAGWQKNQVLSYVPPAMMPNEGKFSTELMEGFVGGLGEPGKPISLDTVPWNLWGQPLSVWIPLIVLAGLCAVSMALIVHRQWAHNERLRYPIADFAGAILARPEDRPAGSILSNRLFWAGLITIFSLRLVNGLAAYVPNSIEIPFEFQWSAIFDKYPELSKIPNAPRLLTPILYPTAVAFAFFLGSDISFSLGFSQVVFVFVAAGLLAGGVNIGESHFRGGPFMWQRFGSYLGIAAVLFLSCRRYYTELFARAIWPLRAGSVPDYAIWAGRILLVSSVAMVVILSMLGLDWPLAAIAVASLLLMYLVMSRINAETGLFLCQPRWEPASMMIGLFGFYSLGIEGLAIIVLFTAVLAIDPRTTLMPFVVNGLKISDDLGAKPGRVGSASVVALLVALAVAVPVVLWANYNWGVMQTADRWSSYHVPNDSFKTIDRSITTLRISDQIDAAGQQFGQFADVGSQAIQQQMALLGLGVSPEQQQQSIAAIQGGPQFAALQQAGEQSILQNASATGGLRGGNVQGALAQFSPQLLNQLIQQQIGQLGQLSAQGLGAAGQLQQGGLGLAQIGAGSAGRQAAAGTAAAGQVGSALLGGAGLQTQRDIAAQQSQAQIISGLFGGAGLVAGAVL